jgi:hypothetical protein
VGADVVATRGVLMGAVDGAGAAALQAAAAADARAVGLGQKALLEEAPAPDAMIGQLRDEAYGRDRRA